MTETFQSLAQAVENRTRLEKIRLLSRLARELFAADGSPLEITDDSEQLVGFLVPQTEAVQFREHSPEELEELRRRIAEPDDWLTPEEFFDGLVEEQNPT